MMPVHYFYNPNTTYRASSLYSRTPVDTESSSTDTEDENESSPKRLHRQRSRSVSGCIYRFFGLSGQESDAKDTDTNSGPVYGNDLESVKKSSNIQHVPVLIEDICSIVEEKHLCTEGLYSVFEGKHKLRHVISMAKFEYDREKLDEMEPRTLAGLLKAFLKGLKTPVLGLELAGMIITIGNNNKISNAKKIKLFARQKKHMSEASQATLHYLLQHFNKVLLHKRENKLTLNILCRNFASSCFPAFVNQYDLKRNPAPMQFLVVYNDLIFPPDADEK